MTVSRRCAGLTVTATFSALTIRPGSRNRYRVGVVSAPVSTLIAPATNAAPINVVETQRLAGFLVARSVNRAALPTRSQVVIIIRRKDVLSRCSDSQHVLQSLGLAEVPFGIGHRDVTEIRTRELSVRPVEFEPLAHDLALEIFEMLRILPHLARREFAVETEGRERA